MWAGAAKLVPDIVKPTPATSMHKKEMEEERELMVEIRCRIIAEPQGETRPIYKTDDKSSLPEPFIRGKFGGELDYVCGNCVYLLAQNVSRDEIPTDVLFQCPRCGYFNEV